MLTTLSTVGYGDYHPQAISEKIIGCFVQIIGSSIFSMVMSGFISVVMNDINPSSGNKEEALQAWFLLIKNVRNQP